ncbi:hypothetical protein [Sinorhizobium fredii]|uniref:Uncharacterized protein n=1 Tax=Rhizobium fredii TaxID=380 RepID=A0A2L0H439_RHIFR|nr:hypothetical protein [Sinorhizobium fredii]AUX76233.1 hypothetical protein NXT3_CH01658 [Sinorhizobium fredii]
MTQTIDIHEVRPRLRFLLSNAAKEEGKKMANLFSTYSYRKDPGRTSSQFHHIIESIKGGRFPNIAQADEVMKGTLTASLQVMVDGRRLPEWLMWRQTWANDLADGRPQHMVASANYMIEYQDKLEQLLDTSGRQFDMEEDDDTRAPRGAVRELSDIADPVLRERLRKKMNDEARLATYGDREICPSPGVVPMILYRMNMTEEEKAREREDDERRSLRDYGKNLISAFELVTGEKFERAWKTKTELHAALRDQFSEYYDEKLSIRTLLLGGYR